MRGHEALYRHRDGNPAAGHPGRGAVHARAEERSTGPPPPEKQKGPLFRTVNGRVTGGDAPLKDAIVYIKNVKTMTLKTYIADDQGKYQFNALLPKGDYEIFADSKGKRATPTLSSFDSRKDVTINLHIDS